MDLHLYSLLSSVIDTKDLKHQSFPYQFMTQHKYNCLNYMHMMD